MRTSIRTRMIVAMNLLVVAVGVIVGWVGIAVAGRAIEHRLVDVPVANAAALAGEMHLPLSDTLMARLSQILDAEVAAGPADGSQISATSMPFAATRRFEAVVQAGPPPRRLTIDGRRYLVASARAPAAAGETRPMRLYLLVPEAQVWAARRRAAWTIALLTLAAIVAATALASLLSHTISRPVRQLADRMHALSEQPPAPGPTADLPTVERGPTELVRLGRAFDRLLDHLDAARAQVARAERLATLGQLAASVAHELRNPLSGIKMNARVLADELARARIDDQSIKLIIREIDRLDLFCQELLDLSNPSAGGAGAPAAATEGGVSLAEVTESVVALLAGRCAHQSVAVERRFDAAAPAVRARPDQLRQVVLNLMLNATDAMPHGGTITVSIAPAGGGAVRLAVADTGPGVQAPPGADIFEPFVTTRPAGSGLGLAVCRQIVARHGGRIGYDTSPAGSTFWFELPAEADIASPGRPAT